MIEFLTLAAWIIGGIVIVLLFVALAFLVWVRIDMARFFKKTRNELLKQKGWRDHEKEQ